MTRSTRNHGASLLLLALGLVLCAAPAAAESVLIQGATVHTMTGEPRQASVLIDGGTIREVGDVSAKADRVVDATGMHVYPGLFNAYTTLGLVEISSISATVDNAELGGYNPHLSAATAVHPASEVIPVTRANGITHAVTVPSSSGDGVIPGQAVLMHLDGWTIEEMALEPNVAMVIRWPAIQTRTFDLTTFSVKSAPFKEAQEKAEKKVSELRDWLDAARHYRQAEGSDRRERNLKLEHLVKVLDGEQLVIMEANAKRDIEAAALFAEEQGLRIVLAGGRDAYKVKEMLAEKDIPVILGLVAALPAEEDHRYDQPYRTMGELVAAGVKVALGTSVPSGGRGGPDGPHGARTLPYEVAMAVGYGLSREDAMRAMTVNPAEIFGVADEVGTLEPGKVANLIVTDGDPLEIQTQIKHVFIGGEETSLENRHDELYERYRGRGR